MTDLEDRLRDTFAAIDRQVVVADRPTSVRWRPSSQVLLAAAAVVAIVAGLSAWMLVDTGPEDVGVAAQAIAPDEFDAKAAAICREVRTSRPALVFQTVDAYRVVAEQRLELITGIRTRLVAVGVPNDDPTVVDRIFTMLGRSEERDGHVLELVELGRLDALASAWPVVDQYIDIALKELGNRGIEECAR